MLPKASAAFAEPVPARACSSLPEALTPSLRPRRHSHRKFDCSVAASRGSAISRRSALPRFRAQRLAARAQFATAKLICMALEKCRAKHNLDARSRSFAAKRRKFAINGPGDAAKGAFGGDRPHRRRRSCRASSRLSIDLGEAIWRSPSYLERQKRGRGRVAGCLPHGVAEGPEFRRELASPITWLVAIARNRAIDRVRAKGTRVGAAADRGGERGRRRVGSAIDRLERTEEQARLDACLEELEARQSAAIRSAFLDGLTYEELAVRERACRSAP